MRKRHGLNMNQKIAMRPKKKRILIQIDNPFHIIKTECIPQVVFNTRKEYLTVGIFLKIFPGATKSTKQLAQFTTTRTIADFMQ